LLATLVERRFVRVGLGDGMYRSNIATLRAVDPQDSVRLPAFAAFNQEHDVIVELTCRDSAGEELFNDTLTVTQE
jgi:hypothetical protein